MTESLDGEVLDAVLDLLPATAKGDDLSALVERGAGVGSGQGGPVDDGFADGEQIGPSHVNAAHGDFLGLGVDIRRLEDMGYFLAAEKRVEPFWCRLLAGDETFCSELYDWSVFARDIDCMHCSYDSGRGIYASCQCIDGHYMGALIIPRAILSPVGGGHLLP